MKLLSAFLSSIVTSCWFVHKTYNTQVVMPNPLEYKPNVTLFYTAHNQSDLDNHIWVASKSIEDNVNFLDFRKNNKTMPDVDFTIEFIKTPERITFGPKTSELIIKFCVDCLPQQVISDWIVSR